jgi:hypothetical protein
MEHSAFEDGRQYAAEDGVDARGALLYANHAPRTSAIVNELWFIRASVEWALGHSWTDVMHTLSQFFESVLYSGSIILSVF